MPEVRLGEPDIKDGYDEYALDGIIVYVLKSMKTDGRDGRVQLNSFLGIKSLEVFGFKVL